jgi:hypothetical protein
MEDMLTILVEFRETLGAMTLPRPATVDYRQALTDAQREVRNACMQCYYTASHICACT